MSDLGIFLLCIGVTWGVYAVIWARGLFIGHHSAVDYYYGFGFAVCALLAFWISDAQSQTAVLLLALACLHGGRLGYHLASRLYRHKGEDARYMQLVDQFSPGYRWKSFFTVTTPHGGLVLLIGLPSTWGILFSRAPAQINVLSLIGLAVFGVGLYFESVADGSLRAFLADPHNRGRYINTGVWSHSRHPNYFGTTTVWWGIWLVAIAGNLDAWWTVVGPLANTVMLTGVLGSHYADNAMGVRPAYREVMVRTRSFLPLPLSRSQIDENERRMADMEARAAAEDMAAVR